MPMPFSENFSYVADCRARAFCGIVVNTPPGLGGGGLKHAAGGRILA